MNRYHVDNGWHAKNSFVVSLNTNNQTINFCGVGAHYQNGIVEQRIWTVTKIARTIILHDQRYWPECVDTMLWPFSVKVAIKRLNFLLLDFDRIQGYFMEQEFCMTRLD